MFTPEQQAWIENLITSRSISSAPSVISSAPTSTPVTAPVPSTPSNQGKSIYASLKATGLVQFPSSAASLSHCLALSCPALAHRPTPLFHPTLLARPAALPCLAALLPHPAALPYPAALLPRPAALLPPPCYFALPGSLANPPCCPIALPGRLLAPLLPSSPALLSGPPAYLPTCP